MAKFSINIPCKAYVKRFLELNYGMPVDFTKDKTLYPEFRKRLEKKNTRYDNRYEGCKFARYTDSVNIKISQDDFYRFGWELSKTDIIDFNRQMEARAKTFMYVIVSNRLAINMNLTDAISYFQDTFNFPEEVWPSESINKDCQRNLTVTKNEILNNISKQIDKISLVKLSGNGTISQQFKKAYETT